MFLVSRTQSMKCQLVFIIRDQSFTAVSHTVCEEVKGHFRLRLHKAPLYV